jgi:MFS transporter, ACS family, tartrate transporter
MSSSPPIISDTSELSERSVGHRTISLITKRLRLLLLIRYAIAFVDRTNISVASRTMNADIGLSDAAFGLGAGLFFTVATEDSSR